MLQYLTHPSHLTELRLRSCSSKFLIKHYIFETSQYIKSISNSHITCICFFNYLTQFREHRKTYYVIWPVNFTTKSSFLSPSMYWSNGVPLLQTFCSAVLLECTTQEQYCEQLASVSLFCPWTSVIMVPKFHVFPYISHVCWEVILPNAR